MSFALAIKENDDPTAKEDEESDLSDDPVLSALNKEFESVLESLSGVWSYNHTSDLSHASPHCSGMLLLQLRIHCCDKRGGGWHSVHAGGLATQSVNILFQVCLPPSRLRAPVSHGEYAISRRTVMNNFG